MVNAISVDVEEYFHASNLDPFIGPARWHKLASRVEASTQVFLEIFSRHKVSGTFFILGYVARRHPGLVKEIAALGHEIASHGYSHRLAFNQTPKAFYRDVRRTKLLLEDLTGKSVLGYRAPSFSIKDHNQWAYDELIRAGYVYDSSIYPVWHPRYANQHKPRTPHIITRPEGQLFELPLAVSLLKTPFFSLRVPVAGGAYWRLLPLSFLHWGLERINLHEAQSFVSYTHPWEVDTGQPIVEELSFLSKIRHYGGTKNLPRRLEFFLNKFRFGTVKEVAEAAFGDAAREAFQITSEITARRIESKK